MTIGGFDLFSIGIGPSSSHTVGPMRAAVMFVRFIESDGLLDSVDSVRAELYGSLGSAGHGHGGDKAVLLGLSGEVPEAVDPATAAEALAVTRDSKTIRLLGGTPEQVAAVKAITAARTAMRGDGTHVVTLDKVIKTMRDTGAGVKTKYKETARGGLAVNVIEC